MNGGLCRKWNFISVSCISLFNSKSGSKYNLFLHKSLNNHIRQAQQELQAADSESDLIRWKMRKSLQSQLDYANKQIKVDFKRQSVTLWLQSNLSQMFPSSASSVIYDAQQTTQLQFAGQLFFLARQNLLLQFLQSPRHWYGLGFKPACGFRLIGKLWLLKSQKNSKCMITNSHTKEFDAVNFKLERSINHWIFGK